MSDSMRSGMCKTCLDGKLLTGGRDCPACGYSNPVPPEKLSQEEWERRFKQRIIDKVGRDNGGESLAQSELGGAGFEYLSDSFSDDPEGSADEAMSYWEE